MAEWISVNDERKPPLAHDEESISISILVYVPKWAGAHGNLSDKGVRLGNYLHKSKVFRPEGSMGFEKDVTHWALVPEPPDAATRGA